jgi:hypothetical protein
VNVMQSPPGGFALGARLATCLRAMAASRRAKSNDERRKIVY